MPWKPCGHLVGQRCDCALMERERRRSVSSLNASIRHQNKEIERGNRRRQHCLEKILEYAMLEDQRKVKLWITKLAIAGFNKNDAMKMESMSFTELQEVIKNLLVPQS